MKGHAIRYSADELAWLSEHRTLPIADRHAAFVARFGRTDVTAQHLHSLAKRKGWRTERTGRFEPGREAANKGKPCAPGQGGRHPNAVATQFPKGVRQGRAQALYKPIGTERVSREGYLERKIHDGMPLQSRWRAVHLINWEAANGPLPKGHCLKCLDGNKRNTNLSNWQLISRALLPTLNGGPHKSRLAFDDAHPEVKPAVLAAAKLRHVARQASTGERP